MVSKDTIFALSSGGLPSGVAVVRLSGPDSLKYLEALSGKLPQERRLERRIIRDPLSGLQLDHGLVCWFKGPASFTGEDVVELHLHGGVAVVSGVLEAIGRMNGSRLADAGEFSRRAFESGKIDLTEAEGLADLVAAETAAQRQMALSQAAGGLRQRLESWREEIIRVRAYIEAEFDFSDEEDVPDSMVNVVSAVADELIGKVADELERGRIGEILRTGFRVALMGPPNAGKSSLLNALARRDVAIVSDIPGTTRDLIDVRLDINGFPVILTDTAGLREDTTGVEAIGISRALEYASESDLIVWMSSQEEPMEVPSVLGGLGVPVLSVYSKSDLGTRCDHALPAFNVRKSDGLDGLIEEFEKEVSRFAEGSGTALINRERHRVELERCQQALIAGRSSLYDDMVIASEYFRMAGDHLGRLTGRVDVEDLLDVIFSEFCIGK